MNKMIERNRDYQVVEQAIQYLEANFREQPSLDDIADSVHLSKYHFQRVFRRWAGVTPNQFLRYLTLEYAKGRLREAKSVLEASLDAGLSGPGRLHDLFVTYEAISPGEYKKLGSGLEICYGFHPTPFGDSLLGVTERGVCALRFLYARSRKDALLQLQKDWPRAAFLHRQKETEGINRRIFATLENGSDQAFHLLLEGTNFQVQVWQALLSIPPGSLVSYGDVAAAISRPSAVRAAARAVARNPVAYLIPCHRVISKTGRAHRYRWGTARKKAMLGWEAARFRVGQS